MTRPRGGSSVASEDSAGTVMDQELGSMYDYLAKVILLGPSGSGKSCLLHRFVKDEWRVLSSQTIGVEFSSKIIKVGTGARRKRIKLQLWDTAGTERFRSVSRSYYRGAAGAILVYDLTSHASFRSVAPFLNDARALASPKLSVLLVGNKLDLASAPAPLVDAGVSHGSSVDSSTGGHHHALRARAGSSTSLSTITTAESSGTIRGYGGGYGGGSGSMAGSAGGHSLLGMTGPQHDRASVAPEGREVSPSEASVWASTAGVPVVTETSAFTGEGVDEVFGRLARMILTKIELGEIDPDDPMSGIQYGDAYGPASWGSDGGSVKSSMTGANVGEDAGLRRRRGGQRYGARQRGGNWGGLREWEEVFSLTGGRRRGGNCC